MHRVSRVRADEREKRAKDRERTRSTVKNATGVYLLPPCAGVGAGCVGRGGSTSAGA